MTNGYKRIGAVKTAMEMLEHISNQPGKTSPKEIAIALRLPYGTVMSHLATLCDGGYITMTPEGGVQIGVRLSLFWLRLKAVAETKRTTIEQALGMLGEAL